MKSRLLVLLSILAATTLLVACGDSNASVTLSGSGASFPAPLYQTWFTEFSKAHPDIRVTYASKGSGGGVNDVIQGVVQFGASDAAMTDEELAAARQQRHRGVKMLPMTAGGVVLIYNLPGVEGLKLTRAALAGIYLGDITRWNDPELAKANPGAALPDAAIFPVHRADSSGTSYAFTNHLSAISEKWRSGPGTSKSPSWPSTAGAGGKKNDGVAALVKQTPNSIGYVELSYAQTAGLPTAQLQNKAGNFVPPQMADFQAALAGETLPPNLRLFVPDPSGADAYPIVTYTWILAYDSYPKAQLEALQQLLRWCLTEGQSQSASLGYVPLPQQVTSTVLAAVDSIQAE